MTALANRRCIKPGCGQWMDNRRGYQRCIACERIAKATGERQEFIKPKDGTPDLFAEAVRGAA